MAQNGKWQKRLGFWIALFVVTAVGTSAGLMWLNRHPSPPAAPSPVGSTPGSAQAPVPIPGTSAPPTATPTPPTTPPVVSHPGGPTPIAQRSLAWADAKQGTVSDPATGYPEEVIDKRTGSELVLIKPGTYERGTNTVDRRRRNEDEAPAHQVTISKPFYLGKDEVTQGQWRKIMGENPSRFKKGDDFPVENVAATEVWVFLKRTGLRLPTEAEWEYGCKAGDGEPLSEDSLDPQGILDGIAWYQHNSGRSTQPIGLKQENGFGIKDMLGNVSEWTSSWYDSAEYNRSVPSVTDPKGPQQGEEVVVRGCMYESSEEECRCSNRNHSHPRSAYFVGFRVAHDTD